MRKYVFAAALASICALSSAQNNAPIYAGIACQSGCAVFNSQGNNFYYGTNPKSFRVCTANGFAAEISVDNQRVHIPETKFSVRGCVDVTGHKLTLLDGEIGIGPLPN